MGAATVESRELKFEEKQSNETNLFTAMRVRVVEYESFAQKVVLL